MYIFYIALKTLKKMLESYGKRKKKQHKGGQPSHIRGDHLNISLNINFQSECYLG